MRVNTALWGRGLDKQSETGGLLNDWDQMVNDECDRVNNEWYRKG